jgi:transcriptional antiterminator RfaH
MSWFVLHVKAHKEKKVSEMLEKMDVEVFCPLIKETKNWSDRKKLVDEPLFKSYVFIKITEKYRGIVFGVPGVMRYLFLEGKPALVRDEEIDVIKEWMSRGTNDVIELSKLIPGNEITVKNGLLKDRKGVIQWVGKSNVSLLLEEMGVVAQARLKDVV